MERKVRPYLYYDYTQSLCAHCLRRVEAKVLIKDDQVFLEKWCPEHGRSRVLIADDAAYYRMARERFIKPPEMPLQFQTETRWGCPYDCGLCPDHMQHSCLTIVEINDHCNLRCPICYAGSGPHRTEHKSLDQVRAMLDAVTASEGTPDVVQISGGEPTIHPEFFKILDEAKRRPIRHLMLNTNGLRIAREPEFTERLKDYLPGFEVYLQFDSLRDDRLQQLRGARLAESRLRALDQLNRLGISTTLVVTVMKGCNDDELGEIIEFALQQPCVRGVTFQPVQAAGRLEGFDPARNRLTLTEVRRRILEQSPVFKPQDLIPVPCNPDHLAMAYAIKQNGKVTPLTGLIPPEVLLGGERNTIVFERDPALKEEVIKLFSTSHSPASQSHALRELLCCLPLAAAPKDWNYADVFRVLIVQFMDAFSFDVRSVKKSCVHFAQPDGKLIPFETYNLLYRDNLRGRLAALRKETERGINLSAPAA
jgi:hypothetical protein